MHLLAFTSAADKAGYLGASHHALTTPLREALHRHGAQLLHDAGIDEPLTWSPPAACVAGLTLSGPGPRLCRPRRPAPPAPPTGPAGRELADRRASPA